MPFRKCVVCGQRDEKERMLRFVFRIAEKKMLEEQGNLERLISLLQLDPLQKMPSRAAYCHPSSVCLNLDGLVSILISLLRGSGRGKKQSLSKLRGMLAKRKDDINRDLLQVGLKI